MRRFRSPDKSAVIIAATPATDNIDGKPVVIYEDSNSCANSDDDDKRNGMTVQRSASGKKLYKSDKEKSLLTDRKFKNNRILKSSSKGKIADLEKRCGDSAKGRGSCSRKISAPPILDSTKLSVAAAVAAASAKKHVRSHSNLNLNALLRYKLSSRKLSTADFDRLRRKSLTGEAADKPKPTDIVIDVIGVDGGDDNSWEDSDKNRNSTDIDEEVFLSASEEPETISKKSPSLSARVAARFADKTTAKAKKAKQKKRKNSRGATLYSQNSFGNFLKFFFM